MIYTQDKQLLEAGARPYYLATSWWWFERRDDEYVTDRVSLDAIDNAAGKTDVDGPLIMDIEEWDLSKDDERERGLCNLRLAALRVRAHFPEVTLGYYRLLPERDYWAPVNYHRTVMQEWNKDEYRKARNDIRAWRNRNAETADLLGSLVDCVCPSVYAFYPDEPGLWRYYTEANLAEAKRVANGKPVYPFIMPVYHDGTAIPIDTLHMMMEYIRMQGVDGIMIYTFSEPDPNWRDVVKQYLE